MRVLLIIVCLASSAADAAEVHFKDDSVVIGTILSLKDAEDLIVDTEDMHEVVIEWEAVCEIRETAVIEVELFADLDFKLTVYDRYDNQPPPGNDSNDTGLTLGLSWSY